MKNFGYLYRGLLILAALQMPELLSAAVAEEESTGLPAWLLLMNLPFNVESINPDDGVVLEELPASISIVLNREVRATTVSDLSVILVRSGGDGTFGDGNEVMLSPNISAGANYIIVDLSGLTSTDDHYQLTLIGTGATPIKDATGLVALDGDGDGSAGGDFSNSFSVAAPPPPPPVAPTLAEVQAAVFTPSCAVSGCHTGNSPAAGQNLTSGQTWSNTVNVQSNQMPSLDRIEPGNPDQSYLIRKIEGDGVATRMPLNRSALPQNLIDMVRDWIEAGAEEGGTVADPGPGPEPDPDPY